MRYVICPNCGSDKLERRPCRCCHDLSPEDYLIRKARKRYLRGDSDLQTFEHEVEQILSIEPSGAVYGPRIRAC